LDLGGTRVTDAVLPVLWALSQLTRLSLAGTQISGCIDWQQTQQEQQQGQEEARLHGLQGLGDEAGDEEYLQDMNQQLLQAGLVEEAQEDVWGLRPPLPRTSAPPSSHHLNPQQEQQQEQQQQVEPAEEALGWHSWQQLVELDLTNAPLEVAAYQGLAVGLGHVLRRLAVGGRDVSGKALSSIRKMEQLQELSVQVG
jgi:hypothetical protein